MDRLQVGAFFAAANGLRADLPALRHGWPQMLHEDRQNGVLAFERAGEGVARVVVVVNCGRKVSHSVGGGAAGWADGQGKGKGGPGARLLVPSSYSPPLRLLLSSPHPLLPLLVRAVLAGGGVRRVGGRRHLPGGLQLQRCLVGRVGRQGQQRGPPPHGV